MEESIWRNFPEDLFKNVMVFLPVRSLLRFCTVSKLWNSIPKDPEFHEIRDTCWREFIDEVLGCRKFRGRTYLKSCTTGFVLMICTNGPGDVFVIRPSKLYLRQIPRPEWVLDGGKYNYEPFGMVVDERTRDYTVIVKSRLRSCSQKADLYQFKSRAGVWSWCGKNRWNLRGDCRKIALHRDFLLGLVWHNNCYQVLRHSGACSWDVVPGNLPDASGMRLLFDHRGTLYFAVSHSSGCSLWEYRDDSLEWTSITLIPNTGFHDLDTDRNFFVDSAAHDFALVAGDFLYFGISTHRREYPYLRAFVWRRMKYNLMSRALEATSLDEIERMLLTDQLADFPFLFGPA